MTEVGEYVEALLAQPSHRVELVPPAVAKQSDIEVIRQFRVVCPVHGELPDGPYPSVIDARTAQRNHFRDHRDERI